MSCTGSTLRANRVETSLNRRLRAIRALIQSCGNTCIDYRTHCSSDHKLLWDICVTVEMPKTLVSHLTSSRESDSLSIVQEFESAAVSTVQKKKQSNSTPCPKVETLGVRVSCATRWQNSSSSNIERRALSTLMARDSSRGPSVVS